MMTAPQEYDDHGRLRILTMVEHIMKIAGLLCLDKINPIDVQRIFEDINLAIGTSGGPAIAIQRFQSFLEDHGASPDIIAIFLDLLNAYMKASRKKMLEKLFEHKEFQPIWRIAHWMLSTPNPRYFSMENGGIFTIHQTEGGPQGDPLMPFLFSVLMLAIHVLLKTTVKAGFLDDTSFGDRVQTVDPYIDKLKVNVKT